MAAVMNRWVAVRLTARDLSQVSSVWSSMRSPERKMPALQTMMSSPP